MAKNFAITIGREFGSGGREIGERLGELLGIKSYDKELLKLAADKKGIHPVIECTQNIPCNPCQDACPKKCISIGENITSLPTVVEQSDCINCGMCVASCSGQAIFLVDEDCGDGTATITLPYEFLPLPKNGAKGAALGRNGEKVCEAEVVEVKSLKAFDKTNLLTMRVPKEYAMKARFFKEDN